MLRKMYNNLQKLKLERMKAKEQDITNASNATSELSDITTEEANSFIAAFQKFMEEQFPEPKQLPSAILVFTFNGLSIRATAVGCPACGGILANSYARLAKTLPHLSPELHEVPDRVM